MASNTSKSWSQLVSRPSISIEDPISQLKSDLDPNNAKEVSFVSLNDVMSEELANQLDTQHVNSFSEDIGAIGGLEDNENIRKLMAESGLDVSQVQNLLENTNGSDTSCDELLAHILQHDFDRQHDHNLKKEEKKFNQNSKVGISYDLYRRVKDESFDSEDSDDDFHEYGEESKHWDSFEKSQRMAVKVGRQGFAVKNGIVTTKHDLETTARKNACKAMDFELKTGDGGGFDMKLNNNVFNALKVHSISEGKRMARLHDKKEKSTAEKVLDEKSRILVFKLMNRGILDTINGVIATGKESVVLHGRGSMTEKGITHTEVAVKIFKTYLNEFRNRVQYIGNDPVLHQTGKLSKQNPKFMIPLWAEKEMHNLNRIRKNGIPCPEVLILKKHVLVMTFIGSDGKAAPTLKEANLNEELLERAWKQTVDMLCKLFKDCNLIHSDFSEYNLLWHENKLWCIDVSQAVLSTHPMAFKFLWRDCNNICKFFAKRCLNDIMTPSELFTKICGKQLDTTCDENEFNSVDLLDKIENYDKSDEFLKYNESDNEDPFEDMLEKSARERTQKDVFCISKSPKS
ncbi:serine/threonine-protein kinase RIO3-like [Oppia nitens]|uniref:serine/threonine-protein kinase RIO3-like n=1 Tax=Oppia nitens TaxID=1686743 RepID=UPI0023DC43E6|nr:serine/threonine-protein kinase RIO3-like [Oppia nitens]